MRTLSRRILPTLRLLNEYRFTHPIWSTVWGALICVATLCALALTSSLFEYWWSLPWDCVAAVSTFLDRTTVVPNWLLTTWGVGTLLVLTLCAIAFRKTHNPSLHYTADRFFGVKWRWEYDDEGQPCNLRSHCPHCYFDITNNFGKTWNDRYEPCSRCPECRKKLQPLGDRHDVWAAVEHMIEKKIRTGDWTNAPSPSSQVAKAREFDPRDAY
jgi:hypothetical protein